MSPETRHFLPHIVEAAVIALEALLAYAWIMQIAAAGLLVLTHFAVVLGHLVAASVVAGGLSGEIAFRSAMLLLVGPLVGVGLVTGLVAGGHREKAKADQAQARVGHAAVPTLPDLQSAQADALYAQIIAGRRARRDASNRRSLKQAIERGDLDAQQFAIAMISQRFEPEMFPALLSALQSTTPAVRVQAAAVFAKLRERMSSEAKAILRAKGDLLAGVTTAPGPDDAVLAARCSHLAASGFVDGDTGRALQRLAQLLAAGTRPSPDAGPAEPPAKHAHVAVTRVTRRTNAEAAGKLPPLANGACAPLLGGG